MNIDAPTTSESAAEPEPEAAAIPIEGQGATKRSGKRMLIALVTIPAVALTAGAAYFAGVQSASTGTGEPSAQPSQAAAQAGAEASVDWDNVVAFDKALDAQDVPALRSLVSPGSPAEQWLALFENMLATDVAAGSQSPVEASTSVYDEATGTITSTSADGTVAVTKDWVTDDAGLIVSWSDAAGTPIAERMMTQSASGSGAGQTVTITGALRTTAGGMMIAVDITTEPGGDYDWQPTYVGPDGIARKPVGDVGPGELTAGATNKAYYYFEDAGFGGSFIYDAWNGNDYRNTEITLKVE